MGIYDRDYYRQERPGLHLSAPTTVIGYLILINVALWLPSFLFNTDAVADALALRASDWAKPPYWWRFLTYGFVHALGLSHVLFNMLALWFLGRDVELVYGRKEFLRLYLVMLVAGSVIWTLVTRLQDMPDEQVLLGASGAVTGVVILFALHFPRRMLLLFFVLPVPAWVVGMMIVVVNLLGMINTPGTGVAYVVHLAGAAFGFLYYRFHWHIGNWVPGSHWFSGSLSFRRFQRRPDLKIHDPREEEEQLSEQVDRILEKISREGEASLTRKERQTLETASRAYQKRRHARQDSS